MIRNYVRQFHETYGLPILTSPQEINPTRLDMRLRLITEEFLELLAACGVADDDIEMLKEEIDFSIDVRDEWNFDMVEAADALGDIAYVVEGMNLELGIDSDMVLAAIQKSNLSKLGEDGKPVYRSDGKVKKGPNFKEPDIKGSLKAQGWTE